MDVLSLPASVFAIMLVFARTGAIMMLMPGIGEIGVPARVRLGLAFAVALIVSSVISDSLPPMPAQPLALGGLVVQEVLVGLFFGSLLRLMMNALVVAGQVAGMETGLAFAQSFDPTQGRQGAILATFLNLTAVTMIFVSGLHHLFLSGIVHSYSVLPAGSLRIPGPDLGDMAQMGTTIVARSFAVGMQMAAPLIAFGLVFYLALGVLSRLMPQVQIFFVAIPVNIFAGLSIFALGLSAMMGVWFSHMEALAQGFN